MRKKPPNHRPSPSTCAPCLLSSAVRLKEGFARGGKKLDMGKSCIRFRTIDDLPLDTIADIIASTPVDAYVAAYEESRKGRTRRN